MKTKPEGSLIFIYRWQVGYYAYSGYKFHAGFSNDKHNVESHRLYTKEQQHGQKMHSSGPRKKTKRRAERLHIKGEKAADSFQSESEVKRQWTEYEISWPFLWHHSKKVSIYTTINLDLFTWNLFLTSSASTLILEGERPVWLQLLSRCQLSTPQPMRSGILPYLGIRINKQYSAGLSYEKRTEKYWIKRQIDVRSAAGWAGLWRQLIMARKKIISGERKRNYSVLQNVSVYANKWKLSLGSVWNLKSLFLSFIKTNGRINYFVLNMAVGNI